MFDKRKYIGLPADSPPKLIVVIDTEEEFDWSAEPDSEANHVSAMAHIDRVQNIFNEYGIHPCYVIDYPIASQPEGYRLLKQFAENGQCEIGAHLHPWVNPPFQEELSKPNTYPGNLPYALEREKLLILRDKITENFGLTPIAYKAGRYGFGPNTATIMQELGFNIVGWAGGAALPLFQVAQVFRKFKAPGILSRLGAVDRLMLSPEGFSSVEHIKLTRALYSQGVRTFTWSFHSPSVVPGNTNYVQDDAQLREFLDSFRRYFDFFFNELGGEASTPTRIRDFMESMA
jgi:hypothetical protein